MRIRDRIARIKLDLDKQCQHTLGGAGGAPREWDSSSVSIDTDDQAAGLLDEMMAPCPDCGARPSIADLARMAEEV